MAKTLSKKYKAALEKFDASKFYTLAESFDILRQISYTKFDPSVDISINLNLDPRKSEQQLRGSVLLPHGNGKVTRVLVACEDSKMQEKAKKAGADIVVSKIELEEILKKQKFEFDVMVAEPKMMITLGKYGKILGPKGLMPNPKTGTVTTDPAKAVEEIKKGKANYRVDKSGIINSSVGKLSMKSEHLYENAKALIDLIKKIKPSTVKGTYIYTITVSSSMSPGIKIKLEI